MLDILPILFFIAILLCFSAFFSGSETAMMSLSKPQIKRMEHGDGAEPLVFRLLKDQQHLLATILVGNMFVNTLLTLLCAILTNRIATMIIKAVNETSAQDHQAQEFAAILLNVAIVTPLIMVFGELTPKSVAYRQSIAISRFAAWPLNIMGRLMRPVLWIFQCVVNAIQWCLFIPRDSHWGMLTQAEVDATLTASVENGSASPPARELLGRIFKFNDITATEIMVPRTIIEAIDDSLTLREAFTKIKNSPHGIRSTMRILTTSGASPSSRTIPNGSTIRTPKRRWRISASNLKAATPRRICPSIPLISSPLPSRFPKSWNK